MKNILNVNGKDYDLRKIKDRSAVLQIIKDAMEGCEEDYFETKGDFKIDC